MHVQSQLNVALAGRYAIERELGRGGMATVYLARDLKHERHVALKVLDPELGALLGGERFLSEIRVTANLQHPNLLPLFDSGSADGLLFYVMPYVDGETLRARLEREKQLPVDEAVRIAVAVAAALDYAHRHGVIHRDLKPENILLHDGQPVVADFGIALAVSNAGGQRITQTGLSLGTPQYMSPEQATGDRQIDGRTDVYSLGAVLYEMLAGDPPHLGGTAQAVIAKLLTERPQPVTLRRPAVPEHVALAVDRALEKLPADRWGSAREFADALTAGTRDPGFGIRERPRDVPSGGPRIPSPGSRTPAVVVIPWVLAAAAAIVAVWSLVHRPTPPLAPTFRIPIGLAARDRVATVPGIPFALSADGRTVVYVGTPEDGRQYQLFVRPLDQLTARPLPGTIGVQLSPTFSPDGRWIAFVQEDRIAKISVDGGPVVPVASLDGAPVAGLEWATPDTILASIGGRIAVVPARGGAIHPIAAPDTAHGESAQWGPHLLADGRTVLYTSVAPDGIANNRTATLSLATRRTAISRHLGTTALGAIADRALWVTIGGVIMAASVDRDGALADDAVPVLEGVLVRGGGAAKAALGRDGTLVYQRGEARAQIVLVDAQGVATPLVAEPRPYWHPRFSPDGSRVALAVRTSRGGEIWTYDIATRTLARLTSDGDNEFPEWTPDGARVLYRTVDRTGSSLRWQRADGSGPSEVLVGSDEHPYEGVVSPDGHTVVYRNSVADEIVARSLDGDHARHPIVSGRFTKIAQRLSPDGRWLAYMSTESGLSEIHVRAFPGPGPSVQVSSGGGTEPVWSPDGRTLYYRRGRTLAAASVGTSPAFAIAARTTLFEGSFMNDPSHANYDVSRDGRRFLMVQGAPDESETIVVYGWERELAARLGQKP